MVKNVYVLGGGITGTIIAYELLKRDVKVTLFESEDHLGGLTGSFKWHDIPIDYGPHIFHTPDKDIIDYWTRNFEKLFIEKSHWSSNYKAGKYYFYPISLEMIDSLDLSVKKKIKEELANRDLTKLGSATNYYDYMKVLVGPTLQSMFFINYPEKVWGLPTTKLDANWAPKRITLRDKITPFYDGQWSAIGMDGCATIFNSLMEKIISLGGQVKLCEGITKLELKEDRIRKISTKKSEYSVSSDDLVINTLSCTLMSKLLEVPNKLRFRGVILGYFLVKGNVELPNKSDFLYFDDMQIIFNRLTNHNKFIANPPKGKTVLITEVAYSESDKYSKKSDSELISQLKSSLISLGYISEKSIIDTKIVRLPEVYPLFYQNYRNDLASLRSNFDKVYNMYTIGARAEFMYSDMQVLVAKARDLARIITDPILKLNNIDKSQPRLKFMDNIEIGKDRIGVGNPSFIIAEIGLNHNGSLKRAKELIDKAIESGVNAVKLQTYSSENRVAKAGLTSKYVEKILGIEETDYEMLKKCELSVKDTKELFDYAKERICIFSTPFDIKSVELLESLNVSAYKIASFDIQNYPLLRAVARTQKPLILSTGMSNLSDIETALNIFMEEGNNKVALLHCISSYPCPPENINLKAMDTIRNTFNIPVGLSDHVIGQIIALAAVARGANIIEKHFTLDKNLEGPDHILSFDPKEMAEFIGNVRMIEASIGDGVKQPIPLEYSTMLRFRKTLHINKSVKKGNIITAEDVSLRGPAFGLPPKYFEFVIGRVAKRDLEQDQPLTLDDI